MDLRREYLYLLKNNSCTKNNYFLIFYSKDLWSAQSGTPDYRSSLQGVTYLNAVCTNNSYALIEDIGIFYNIEETAHDIAHVIGVQHDGTGNGAACDS